MVHSCLASCFSFLDLDLSRDVYGLAIHPFHNLGDLLDLLVAAQLETKTQQTRQHMKSKIVKQCVNADYNDTHASRAVVVEQMVCLLLISLDVYVVVLLCLEAGYAVDVELRSAREAASRSALNHGRYMAMGACPF